ncbi:MAG: tetratricopeptide repeat protein [Elusimicrobiota bacterium]|jgi:tetratricopeptide (TPR) repeat protein|nr:tetratricopeptide repeat protein [Elusimicrobiota bacterium]
MANISDENNRMELGKLYFLNNRFDEAVKEFKEVIKLNPGNAEAYYHIGLINESQNKVQEAKEMYTEALKYKEDYKMAQDRLNKLIGIEEATEQ